MNEKPLERLHFFNGQRLQAEDFRLEQDYHMRVRRWLNRSLYTSGIASGLEVRKIPGSPSVIVGPGLALDHFGREIILLDERPAPLQGRGIHYLTIRYQEDTTARREACCPTVAGSKNHTASGGPSRILAEPLLEWSTGLPHEESGRVLLARVELSAGCKDVKVLDTSVRRYVGAASAAKVRQYALEGERLIDADNPGRIYFHIRGRQASGVTLYLRAEKFSSLFYTELGQHKHSISGNGFSGTFPEHKHRILEVTAEAVTGTSGGHTPSYSAIQAEVQGGKLVGNVGDPWGFVVGPTPDPARGFLRLNRWMKMAITFNPVDDHFHSIPSETLPEPKKAITLSGNAISSHAGVSDITARSDVSGKQEKSLTYVENLQVWIGKDITNLVNCTKVIKDQLEAIKPGMWGQFGNGEDNHVLITEGTGAIKLDFLPNLAFTEGEYVIDLRVEKLKANGNANGGRIHYNLYIE